MAKQTHTVELTLEELSEIVRSEFHLQGSLYEFYHFQEQDDILGHERPERFEFTFTLPEKELPF